MRTSAGIAALAMAIAMSAAGCIKQSNAASSPVPPPPDTSKITFKYLIGACPLGTTPIASESYGIELGANFKLDNPAVRLTYPVGQKARTPHSQRPTRLDIATDLIDVAQVGTVTITLKKGSNLSFAQGGMAFNGGDANAPSIFCNPTLGANSDGEPTLTFTVLPQTGKASASYILGLIATDADPHSADVLPILIDPVVDNNGVAKGT